MKTVPFVACLVLLASIAAAAKPGDYLTPDGKLKEKLVWSEGQSGAAGVSLRRVTVEPNGDWIRESGNELADGPHMQVTSRGRLSPQGIKSLAELLATHDLLGLPRRLEGGGIGQANPHDASLAFGAQRYEYDGHYLESSQQTDVPGGRFLALADTIRGIGRDDWQAYRTGSGELTAPLVLTEVWAEEKGAASRTITIAPDGHWRLDNEPKAEMRENTRGYLTKQALRQISDCLAEVDLLGLPKSQGRDAARGSWTAITFGGDMFEFPGLVRDKIEESLAAEARFRKLAQTLLGVTKEQWQTLSSYFTQQQTLTDRIAYTNYRSDGLRENSHRWIVDRTGEWTELANTSGDRDKDEFVTIAHGKLSPAGLKAFAEVLSENDPLGLPAYIMGSEKGESRESKISFRGTIINYVGTVSAEKPEHRRYEKLLQAFEHIDKAEWQEATKVPN